MIWTSYASLQEEDLFTMSYGLPLKDEGDDKCLSILNSVEETVSRQLRACKTQPSKKKVLEGIHQPYQYNKPTSSLVTCWA